MEEKLSEKFDLDKISADIGCWLDSVSNNLESGRFKYCLEKSLVPSTGKMGLVSTCFALKIAWQCGIWETWGYDKKKACIEFIKSFQNQKGYFVDPWLADSCKIGLKEKLLSVFPNKSIKEYKRKHEYNFTANVNAETRQACSVLLMLGSQPRYKLPTQITNVRDAEKFISNLNRNDPWHLCSQISHQIMILSVNKEIFSDNNNYKLIMKFFETLLKKNFSEEFGSWFIENETENQMKINAAMKIYSGLAWIDYRIKNKKLIDLILNNPIVFDGCSFNNSLFALYHARIGIEKYREREIHAKAFQSLNHSLNHKKPSSGFSFHLRESKRQYYTQFTSKGNNQADLHGTTMFVLGITLALRLLGDNAPVGHERWKLYKG